MARTARALHPDPLEPTIILVGQDLRGRYCVCENHGMVGGAFASRADAVRFAQIEGRAIPHSIVMITPLVINVDATDCSAENRLAIIR